MMTLTPDANAEVRRQLCLRLGLILGISMLAMAGIVLAITPSGMPVLPGLGLMLGFGLLYGLSIAGTYLTLAYPLGCWPAFLPVKRIEEIYKIKASDGFHGRLESLTRVGFWVAYIKGVSVGLAFATPWFLAAWAMGWGRSSVPGWMVILVLSNVGNVSARAWAARKLVASREQDRFFTSSI